jgi:hypothetical protein
VIAVTLVELEGLAALALVALLVVCAVVGIRRGLIVRIRREERGDP